MKKQIAFYKSNFIKETSMRYIIDYLNGFCAAGVLKKPKLHLKGVESNTLWFYYVGMNSKGNKIKEIISVEVAQDEANDLIKCLTKVKQ